MTCAGKPFSMYASGLTIDSCVNAATSCLAAFAYSASLSRSGPTLPLAAAGLNVWQLPQPLFTKTVFPAFNPGPLAAWPCFETQASYAADGMTMASERMKEWPSPQSSVQMIG